MSAGRQDLLRLLGSAGANRIMEAEFLRLVKRSPFEVRLPKPVREGDATLLYPFDARVAWVAACFHRTSSRVGWELWASEATRLEPLYDDLLPLIEDDDRLDPPRDAPRPLRISVEVKASEDFEAGPLQLRGVVKNAILDGLERRGVAADLDADEPDLVFAVRRGGMPEERLTRVALDIGGGPRHRRGERVAMVAAPLRETLAAQLILFSRWDARSELLVDAMTGGGTLAVEAAHLAVGHPVREPRELPFQMLRAFEGMPRGVSDLFPGTEPRILAADADPQAIKALVGNLRAAHLTGQRGENRIVLRQQDARDLSPGFVAEMLGTSEDARGVIVMNPPYGERLDAGLDRELLRMYRDVGRACAAFRGWRVAVFVAHPGFREAFGGGFGADARIIKPASNAALRGWFLLYDGAPAAAEDGETAD